MGTWTLGFNATGPTGASVRTGSGAPASSLGNAGDVYFDVGASPGPNLYGPKDASNGWPSSFISLAGATGAAGPQFLFGTTQPGPPTWAGLNIGDFFLRSDTFNLYQFQRISGSVGLALVGNLQGGVGPQGLSVITGSGAPSSSIGAANQAYIDSTNGILYVKGSSAWPSTGLSLVGPQGNFLRTGSGAPASGLGNVGDTYVDTTSTGAPIFYGAKTSSGWPSTGVSLVGAQGTSVRVGSGAPASGTGSVGDIYFDTTSTGAPIFYSAKTSSGWPSSGTSLLGATGTQGLSVLTGSGAPASTLGVQTQAYIDAATPTLYVKGSSAWSTGITLVGTQGVQGNKGDVGPASPGLRSGSGAPTSSYPSYQVDGDYYIRTDTTPNQLYGPRASGSWPSSGVSTGGTIIQQSSGPPASTLGAIGDQCVDTLNGFFYPSKTSSGWTAAPFNMVGPTGPSVQAQPLLGSLATGAGTNAYANGLNGSSTPAVLTLAGTTLPAYWTPTTSSYFVQATIVNASNSSGSVTLQLYDTVAATVVYTSPSYGTGTINTVGFFAPTSTPNYPLTANNPLVWRVTGASTAYVSVQPSYLYQSSTGIGVSAQPTFALGSTSLSTSAAYLLIPGSTILTGYWTSPKAAYLNTAQFNLAGSGASAVFALYSGSTIIYTSPTITPANSPYNVGPLGLTGAVLPAATTCSWRVTGSGTATALAVNWSAIQ